MKVHGNAALGPAGRLALVQAIESGMTLRAAAAALNVAPATAHRWWHRWRAADEMERQSGSWLADRSSRPRHHPRRLARFNRPGHAVTGVRDMTGAEKRAGVGYVYLHCVIDDNSRYAYVEQHPGQGGDTAAGVLERAIEHFAQLGMKPPEAVMSDNAFAYRRSNAFRAVLERHRARHILTPPYTPRWNGKVERFIQTLKREWAYAHSWPNSAERARAMASFLRYYNRRRPHSSLGDRPPISRVHNARGQDN